MNGNAKEIEKFLREVDGLFPVPLSHKQPLSQLAEKLAERATLCAVQQGERLLALVAGYTENTPDGRGYISVVACLPEVQGQGHASRLVRSFIEIAARRGLSAVHLYTVRENRPAVRMYERLGFVEWRADPEPRPDDLHLIYEIKESERK